MIKLSRTTKPTQLTDILQETLTNVFKNTGESVWNKDYIKDALLEFSFNKCCFCEANLTESSLYMEVEHFHPKELYKDDVLEWNNLLPSCKRCNGAKFKHDTKIEPIIDPTQNDPKNHLKLEFFRIKGKDTLGKLTVSVLDLNDIDRLVICRFNTSQTLIKSFEDMNDLMDDYIEGIQTSTKRKNRIINGTKELMRQALPSAIYAATTATIILELEEYKMLKVKLTQCSFWDSDFQKLENEIQKIAFI